MQGWIKLHRKIKDHWLYKESKKFTKFEAWIDLLLEANHKDNKFLLGSELVEVKRGQTITSIRKLCERWGWSNTKVTQYLNLLQNDGMIWVESDSKKTVITIVNYELYQVHEDEKTTQNRHEDDTKQTQKHTNKNDKNVKNEKNKKSHKQVYDETSLPYQLAVYFYERILENNPEHKKPNFQKWADDIRKMMEIDKRTEEQIRYLMKWVQQDDFEKVNVLSPDKLRKRFDQLVMKVKQQKTSKNVVEMNRQPKVNVEHMEKMKRLWEGRG
jgi:hypothetical protein